MRSIFRVFSELLKFLISLAEMRKVKFKCPIGHVEHADVNAAFNHASPSESIVRLLAERDVNKRNSDIRQEATLCV
jgi:hypothetical protein